MTKSLREKQLVLARMGAKMRFSLGDSKEEAFQFLSPSLLSDLGSETLIEVIESVYSNCEPDKVKVEFEVAGAFVDQYKDSEGKEIDDDGHDKADRAVLAAIKVLAKINEK